MNRIKIIAYSFSTAISLVFFISIINWLCAKSTHFPYNNDSFKHILYGISLGFFCVAIPLAALIISILKIAYWVDEL